MGWSIPGFYSGALLLHLLGFVFFLPREANPLPLGMKTGFLVQAAISVHALLTAFSGLGSVAGFLDLSFVVVVEIAFWLGLVVFGVFAKSVRFLEGVGEWLDEAGSGGSSMSTSEALQFWGDVLESVAETGDGSGTDSTADGGAGDRTRSRTRSGSVGSGPGTDDDVSKFREQYEQMKDRAFRRR